MSAGLAIVLHELTKDFELGLCGRRLRAVDRLCLRVQVGEVFGLLGPNGSGKTTTVRIMLGLIAATAGECRIFDLPSGTVESRRTIGYLPEAPHFQRFLTGRELVALHGGLCGLRGAALKARVEEVLAWTGLAGSAGRRVGTYSTGMLQRVGLAQALVHNPRLVILDEPAAAMDPEGVLEIAALILRLKAEGRTVVIVSHLLSLVEQTCDHVAILARGRLIREGALADVAGLSGHQTRLVERLAPEHLAELRGWLAARGRSLLRVDSSLGGLVGFYGEPLAGDGSGRSAG